MKGNLYVRTPVCVPAAEIQLITVHTVDCTDTIHFQCALFPLSDKIFSVAPTDLAVEGKVSALCDCCQALLYSVC